MSIDNIIFDETDTKKRQSNKNATLKRMKAILLYTNDLVEY